MTTMLKRAVTALALSGVLLVNGIAIQTAAAGLSQSTDHYHSVDPDGYRFGPARYQICRDLPGYRCKDNEAFNHTGHHARTYAPINHSHDASSHSHPYAAVEHTHDDVPEHTHEAPEPTAQACTYEHRIVGVPGTTGGGYIGRVWVSSKKDDATARIRAYQGDNGHPLDLLDGDGQPIGPVVSLSPANSIKQFRTEGARGWHVVTVTHATARSMHSASVVLRIRGPDGVQIVPIPPSEHCETASTTTQ